MAYCPKNQKTLKIWQLGACASANASEPLFSKITRSNPQLLSGPQPQACLAEAKIKYILK